MNVFTHSLTRIILIFKCFMVTPVLNAKPKLGPHLKYEDSTNCDEFTQFARFNPYTMLNSTWMVFYYWAPPTPMLTYHFTMPRPEDYEILHDHLENHLWRPINWTARHVLMWNKGTMALLVESGDRGQFELHIPHKDVPKGTKLYPIDVRFKQTGDNKVVGMMFCEDQMVYAMSRMKDIPRQNQLQDAAARLKYRARGGKSYLYQGHNWMPIPERDERAFWSRRKLYRFMVD